MAVRRQVGNLRHLFFWPFLEIGLTFASLKAPGSLCKDIEKLQISATGLASTSVPSLKTLPGSLSMPAAFVVPISLK